MAQTVIIVTLDGNASGAVIVEHDCLVHEIRGKMEAAMLEYARTKEGFNSLLVSNNEPPDIPYLGWALFNDNPVPAATWEKHGLKITHIASENMDNDEPIMEEDEWEQEVKQVLAAL